MDKTLFSYTASDARTYRLLWDCKKDCWTGVCCEAGNEGLTRKPAAATDSQHFAVVVTFHRHQPAHLVQA
jgi:hypothetical protein